MIANNMMPSEPVHPRRFRTHQTRLAAFFRTNLRLIENLYALKCSPKKRLYFTTNAKKHAFVVKYNMFGLRFFTVAAVVRQPYMPHFFGEICNSKKFRIFAAKLKTTNLFL